MKKDLGTSTTIMLFSYMLIGIGLDLMYGTKEIALNHTFGWAMSGLMNLQLSVISIGILVILLIRVFRELKIREFIMSYSYEKLKEEEQNE